MRQPGLRAWLGALAAFVILFVWTAPWYVLGRSIHRLTAPLALAAILCALALVPRGWRAAIVGVFRDGIARVSGWRVVLAGAAAALLLARILFARYAALTLSAWDTTVFYDRPIAETLLGRPFFCDFIGGSYFGNHVTVLLFGFIPFYALWPTPVWLLGAEALALAAGAAAGFFAFRRILGDDLSAGFLSAAFLLNTYTAKTLQYGFHPEAFYPLAVFLLWSGLLLERPWILAAGTLLAISVKEDAVLLLVGFALSAAVFHRRYRAAAAVACAGAVAYLVSSRVVMPHFSGDLPARPWYALFWASWGDSLPQAVLAMAAHPLRLAGALLHSGVPHLLEPLALTPLAGPEGLLAALPALIPYGAADFRQLREFALYYSMAVLPFLYIASCYGLLRLARSPARRRVGALVVVCACALDGGSYSFQSSNPARADIGPALTSLGDRPVRVQGTLYPHAGYASSCRVLDRARTLAPGEAVLLAPATSPYPFTPAEMAGLVRGLSADPNYVRSETPHGLILFVPRS